MNGLGAVGLLSATRESPQAHAASVSCNPVIKSIDTGKGRVLQSRVQDATWSPRPHNVRSRSKWNEHAGVCGGG